MEKKEYYIFIDKKMLNSGKKGAGQIFGNVAVMAREANITIKKLDKRFLDNKVAYVKAKREDIIKMLGVDKFYSDENYHIERTGAKRSNLKV